MSDAGSLECGTPSRWPHSCATTEHIAVRQATGSAPSGAGYASGFSAIQQPSEEEWAHALPPRSHSAATRPTPPRHAGDLPQWSLATVSQCRASGSRSGSRRAPAVAGTASRHSSTKGSVNRRNMEESARTPSRTAERAVPPVVGWFALRLTRRYGVGVSSRSGSAACATLRSALESART
jgi:hypothetical protein